MPKFRLEIRNHQGVLYDVYEIEKKDMYRKDGTMRAMWSRILRDSMEDGFVMEIRKVD